MRREWRAFTLSVVVGCLLAAVAIAVLVDRRGDQPDGAPTASDSPRSEERPATPQPTRTPVKKTPKPSPTKPPAPEPTYVFPIADCAVSYSADHHNYPATDVFAARGCAFVAPTDGVVDEVGALDRWSPETNLGADRGGLFVSVLGADGVRYYGSHLSALAPGIGPGDRITAGDRLGSIGETGSARGTGAHLHFGISWPTAPERWWVRRGVVSPAPYLDAWRAGRDASPALEVADAEARLGSEMGTCTQYC